MSGFRARKNMGIQFDLPTGQSGGEPGSREKKEKSWEKQINTHNKQLAIAMPRALRIRRIASTLL
jgi:hypothetical protein